MDRINRAMQGTNDLEQMMNDVLDAMLSIFDSDRAHLLYPCDQDALHLRWSWSAPARGIREEKAWFPRPQMPPSTFNYILRQAEL